MSDTRYPIPVSHHVLRASDLAPMVVLPDGTRMTLDDWKQARITKAEYDRLSALKRQEKAADEASGRLTWNPALGTYEDTSTQEEPSWM